MQVVLNVTVTNNSDEPYTQMIRVSKDVTNSQFQKDRIEWEHLVENNKSTCDSDDELIDLWESLGYSVEYINPDLDIRV